MPSPCGSSIPLAVPEMFAEATPAKTSAPRSARTSATRLVQLMTNLLRIAFSGCRGCLWTTFPPSFTLQPASPIGLHWSGAVSRSEVQRQEVSHKLGARLALLAGERRTDVATRLAERATQVATPSEK